MEILSNADLFGRDSGKNQWKNLTNLVFGDKIKFSGENKKQRTEVQPKKPTVNKLLTRNSIKPPVS